MAEAKEQAGDVREDLPNWPSQAERAQAVVAITVAAAGAAVEYKPHAETSPTAVDFNWEIALPRLTASIVLQTPRYYISAATVRSSGTARTAAGQSRRQRPVVQQQVVRTLVEVRATHVLCHGSSRLHPLHLQGRSRKGGKNGGKGKTGKDKKAAW